MTKLSSCGLISRFFAHYILVLAFVPKCKQIIVGTSKVFGYIISIDRLPSIDTTLLCIQKYVSSSACCGKKTFQKGLLAVLRLHILYMYVVLYLVLQGMCLVFSH
jgi:hypothetical protein